MDREVSPLELENRVSDEELVSTFDVENITIDALLFQTGYLTITAKERDARRPSTPSTIPTSRCGTA